jgi:PAS domain S-box-containing protein
VSAKILIVEDESIVALNIQSRLEGLGYTVTAIVTSGEEALQSVAENRPDLVLMDIKLQGKVDGIEAARQIRDRFHIPVVYLTAYTNREALERAKFTQPYGYILKPFEARDLSSTIEVALYNHYMERQLWEREQWLGTTLKSIGDAVIATDARECITFMNPIAEALTGWQQGEVLGGPLSQVFHTIEETTRTPRENPVTRALRDGAIVELENHTLLVTREGREIPIDDTAAPIRNDAGTVLGAVLVFHDIIDRKRIETLLQQANTELEARVAQSTAQLREANEQLRAEIAQRQRLEDELRLALEKERELSELKSRIVATISHEYRTPLTTILSSTEMLQKYSDRLNAERKEKHFQRIQASVEYLTKLVNDVLFVNQAEAKTLEFNPAPLNLEQFTRELVEEFQFNTPNRPIEFEYSGEEFPVSLDEKLLQAILRNLLSNAIKYSPPDSPVRLEVTNQSPQIIFRVSDRGIGIPPTIQERLFDAFYRGTNVGITPGAGLGLAIVKESVDLHGGEIAISSEIGAGTTFTITLPQAA